LFGNGFIEKFTLFFFFLEGQVTMGGIYFHSQIMLFFTSNGTPWKWREVLLKNSCPCGSSPYFP
jgi:hypothetical protein